MELKDKVNSVSKMVNFPTWIPDCDSHSPVFLYSFISSDTASACYIALFSLLGNTDQVVSMSFLSESKGVLIFIAQLLIILVLIGTVLTII